MSKNTAPEPDETAGSDVKTLVDDATTKTDKSDTPRGTLWKYVFLFFVATFVASAVMGFLLGLLQGLFGLTTLTPAFLIPAGWMSSIAGALFAANTFTRDHQRAPSDSERWKLIVWSFGISILLSVLSLGGVWLIEDVPVFQTYSAWAIIRSVFTLLFTAAITFAIIWFGYTFWAKRALRTRKASRGAMALFWIAVLAAITAASAFLGFGYTGVKAYLGLGNSTAELRDQSVDVAEQAILNVGNVNLKDLDKWENDLRSTLTGDALDQATSDGLDDLRKQVKSGAAKNSEITSVITRSAPTEVSVGDNTATVLVFSTATSKDLKSGETMTLPMNFLVTVVDADGTRKASKIVPLSGVPYVEDAKSAQGGGQSGSGSGDSDEDSTGSTGDGSDGSTGDGSTGDGSTGDGSTGGGGSTGDGTGQTEGGN